MFGLNNRELASAIWLLFFLVLVLSRDAGRRGLVNLAKAFFVRQLLVINSLIVFIGVATNTVFEVISPWAAVPYKNLLFWIIGTGFFSTMQVATKGKAGLSDFAADSIKLFVVFEFLVNVNTFNLVTEMVFVPLVNFLVLAGAVAETRTELQKAAKVINSFMSLVGISLIVHLIFKLYGDWGSYLSEQNLRDLAYPIAMSVLFSPFLYLFHVYCQYEKLYTQVWCRSDQKSLARWFLLRAVWYFFLDAEAAKRWWKICIDQQAKESDAMAVLVKETKARMRRESKKMSLPLTVGFSLWDSMHFLKGSGLQVLEYDQCFGGRWSGYSNRRLESEGLSNSISYKISGSESVVEELELSLDVTWPEHGEQDAETFLDIACALAISIFPDGGMEDIHVSREESNKTEQIIEGKKVILEYKKQPFLDEKSFSISFTIRNQNSRYFPDS